MAASYIKMLVSSANFTHISGEADGSARVAASISLSF